MPNDKKRSEHAHTKSPDSSKNGDKKIDATENPAKRKKWDEHPPLPNSKKPRTSTGNDDHSKNSVKDETRLFPVLVRGLGEVSIADIEDLFSACGTIKSSRITGHGKAIVNFNERPSATAAHKLDGTEFEGRTIRVSLIKPVQNREIVTSQEVDDDTDLSFTVVVNNIPPGTNEDDLEVACQKHGVVSSVRLDPKKKDIAWIEFEDKKGARAAARKGVRVGRVICKAVRVMPKAFKAASSDGGEGSGGGGGGGGKAGGTTALIRGIPDGATADEVRALYAGCGAIRDVRIACPASGRVAFVDFETKTSLHKARRLRPTLKGAALSVKVARHVAPPRAAPAGAGAGAGGEAADRRRPAFCRTIIVKNLPYQLGDTEERLKQRLKRVFQVCGSVAAVRPFMDRPEDGGPPAFKGVAFVQFRETEAVDAALRMDGRDNEGRPMKIDWSDSLDAALSKKKAERRASAGDARRGGAGGR